MARKGMKKSYSKKRRVKKSKRVKRSRRNKKLNSRRKGKRSKKTRKRRRRKRKQRGGGALGNCNNPFPGRAHAPGIRNGNYMRNEPIGRPYGAQLNSRQLTGSSLKGGQKGGGTLWNNLGLNLPNELYHDGINFFKNVKNTYVGDRQLAASDVMEQPISKQENPRLDPLDYGRFFTDSEKIVATDIEVPTST